nr:uncharacterized protein C17orf50 homolog [Pogona vitticeps]
MSQDGEKEEGRESEELEEEEKEPLPDAETSGSRPSACTSPVPKMMEQGGRRESWLWGLLSFPLLSGRLGERRKTLQEPLCCRLERNSSSDSGMCPECEIIFCRKCEKLHYSPVFIEHGLLGHSPRNLPGDLSPAPNTDSMDLVQAPEETEEKEIKDQ